jgi:hypothetical protein
MADDAGSKTYNFKPGSNPCDICKSMEGEYDTAPALPVHPNCDCSTERTTDNEEGWECDFEIRNLECYNEQYTESGEVLQLVNEEDADGTAEFEAQVDDGVKEAANWSPTAGTLSQSVTVPAKSVLYATINYQLTEHICKADKYKVCVKPDPVAGVQSKETKVGQTGGGAVAMVGIASISVDTEPVEESPPSDPGPYYDSDEEIPT